MTGGAFTEGIGVTTYFPGQIPYAGLGLRNGHVVAGAAGTFLFRDFKTTVGDQMIGLNTGNVGLGLALKGVSIHRRRELECNDHLPKPNARLQGYVGLHCSPGIEVTKW